MFFNVSTECDECYSLVADEADILKAMQKNITDYADLLTANDNNTLLGSFSSRLDATNTKMDGLVTFVCIMSIIIAQHLFIILI